MNRLGLVRRGRRRRWLWLVCFICRLLLLLKEEEEEEHLRRNSSSSSSSRSSVIFRMADDGEVEVEEGEGGMHTLFL